jgi:hypothetical protein
MPGQRNASASASVDCSKPGDGDRRGDLAQTALGLGWAAFNSLVALKDPALALASKTVATFQALGEISASGATCAAAGISAAASASASVNVSVSASASFSANSM